MAKKPAPKGSRNTKPQKKAAPSATGSRGATRTTSKPAKKGSKTQKPAGRKNPAGSVAKVKRSPAGVAVARTAVAASGSKTARIRGLSAPPHRTNNRAAVAELPLVEGKAERALTRQDIEQFRLLLLQKRAEILGDVSTLHNEALNKDRREAAGDLSSMPIHMADLGTDNYELEFTLGLIEGERTILKEIDEALDRIQQGTFGICLATGRPIGKARLRAKPWAKYCYEYALAQEKGQGRRL